MEVFSSIVTAPALDAAVKPLEEKGEGKPIIGLLGEVVNVFTVFTSVLIGNVLID